MLVTVGPTGADYTSLAAAEAGEQQDLTALGDIIEFEVQAYNDTGSCTFDGWTTSSTHYIRVYPAAGAEAQMPWSGSAFRMTASNIWAFDSAEDYVRIERLQIEQNISFAFGCCNNTGVQMRLDGCVIRSTDTSGTLVGVQQTSAGAMWMRNCYVYDMSGVGVTCGAFSGGEVRIYNCTIVNNGSHGVNRAGDDSNNICVIKNTLSAGNGGNDFQAGFGPFSSGTDYNASSDGTAPGTNSRTSQTFTFADAGSDDYHLDPGDTGALEFGQDLSADGSWPFSIDFDGETRASPWDIGADQIVSGGGGPDYEESPTGTVNLSGSLTLQVLKNVGGTITPSATCVRTPAKRVAGTVSASATLVKAPRKIVAGSVSPTGAMSKGPRKIMDGEIEPSGDLVQARSYVRAFTGTITPDGELSTLAILARFFTGSITPTGALQRDVRKVMAGTVTPAGAVIKRPAKLLAGTVTSAGSLLKRLGRSVSGSVSAAGTLVRQPRKTMGGSIAPTATTTRVMWKNVGGQIVPAGVVVKQPRKGFVGALSLAGALLAQLTGSFSVFRPGAKASIVETDKQAGFTDPPSSSASWSD